MPSTKGRRKIYHKSWKTGKKKLLVLTLYLSSQMQDMPTGHLRYEEFSNNKNINDLLESTYGFYLVDIEVPKTDEM